MVPECHHLFAADCAWWDKHYATLNTRAERWTVSGRAKLRYNLNLLQPPDHDTFNSGQRAIQLAAHLGAERIILLGYDCSLVNGTHWHGDHPGTLKNPDSKSITRWAGEFQRLADSLPDVDIINCSRHTALTCFRTSTLQKVLYA